MSAEGTFVYVPGTAAKADAFSPLTRSPNFTPIGLDFAVALLVNDEDEVIGLNIGHVHENGEACCEGPIFFDTHKTTHPVWHLESPAPLTLSPSIHLPGHYHGFIRQGRWEPA